MDSIFSFAAFVPIYLELSTSLTWFMTPSFSIELPDHSPSLCRSISLDNRDTNFINNTRSCRVARAKRTSLYENRFKNVFYFLLMWRRVEFLASHTQSDTVHPHHDHRCSNQSRPFNTAALHITGFGNVCTGQGDRGGTVVKVLCYKSEGRWFDSRQCHWNFSLT